jgi:hypothetical protein
VESASTSSLQNLAVDGIIQILLPEDRYSDIFKKNKKDIINRLDSLPLPKIIIDSMKVRMDNNITIELDKVGLQFKSWLGHICFLLSDFGIKYNLISYLSNPRVYSDEQLKQQIANVYYFSDMMLDKIELHNRYLSVWLNCDDYYPDYFIETCARIFCSNAHCIIILPREVQRRFENDMLRLRCKDFGRCYHSIRDFMFLIRNIMVALNEFMTINP